MILTIRCTYFEKQKVSIQVSKLFVSVKNKFHRNSLWKGSRLHIRCHRYSNLGSYGTEFGHCVFHIDRIRWLVRSSCVPYRPNKLAISKSSGNWLNFMKWWRAIDNKRLLWGPCTLQHENRHSKAKHTNNLLTHIGTFYFSKYVHHIRSTWSWCRLSAVYQVMYKIWWLNGKQCRSWSDATFCGIWSGSTLFAQTCQSKYLGVNMVFQMKR